MRLHVRTVTTIVTLLAGGALAHGAAQTQSVNPEVLQLRTASDLVAQDVGFNGVGEIILTLHNRGAVGVNEARPGARSGGGAPIRIDVYLAGTLLQTLYQPGLPGHGSRNFAIKLPSNVPKCADSRPLRVVVDPQNAIAEVRDDNNVTALTAARPCPDLAVFAIERKYTGLVKETYQAEVTIINRGNWPSPPTQVWGTSLSTAPGITGWPELNPTHNIPALAPGQKTSFYIGGSVLSTDSSWVRILLDRYFQIEELNETNNLLDKRI